MKSGVDFAKVQFRLRDADGSSVTVVQSPLPDQGGALILSVEERDTDGDVFGGSVWVEPAEARGLAAYLNEWADKIGGQVS